MFEFLSGQDIVDYYRDTKIYSCMTGKMAFHTELYGLNPDKVRLLIDGQNMRTLVWNCDEGFTYVDHVYDASASGKYMDMVRAFIKENNYLSAYSYPQTNKLSVTLKVNKVFPSLDTFHWLRFKQSTKEMTAFNSKVPRSLQTSDSTIGNVVPWEEATLCHNCHRRTIKCKETDAIALASKARVTLCYLCIYYRSGYYYYNY